MKEKYGNCKIVVLGTQRWVHLLKCTLFRIACTMVKKEQNL